MVDREKVIKGLECCSQMSGNVCRKCPYWDECHDTNLPLYGIPHLASDALELLKEQQETIASFQGTNRKLFAVLAEQPEQKHGHWVYDPDGMDWGIPAWRCSECHCRNDNIPPNIESMNPLRWAGSRYCPNCGAKMGMEVKKDGQQTD